MLKAQCSFYSRDIRTWIEPSERYLVSQSLVGVSFFRCRNHQVWHLRFGKIKQWNYCLNFNDTYWFIFYFYIFKLLKYYTVPFVKIDLTGLCEFGTFKNGRSHEKNVIFSRFAEGQFFNWTRWYFLTLYYQFLSFHMILV